ncbi:GAF domain-containing protein [Nocardioides rubriscoriae]|uniref:sensor histidine kinase n=1 Tax=Nocardioides rubriscoriae TaxID=642762 RepID=UPI0011DF1B16|nr:GAF domain-containing protein [Nocardioides rubriscoriae]
MTTPLGQVDFDDLLREVLARVQGVLDEQVRLRLLLDAVVTMAADLTLDGVLARIVAIASTLVDAEYAALGVLGEGPERRLRTFVHHGMTTSQVARIGDLPTGHGLLGQIIDHPRPLRLHDIAEHPSSFGFPERHPPMSSFLGVPVRIRDQVFGNLYLTEKSGGVDFTEQDENIVVALAAAAGVVIENARLYEQTARREHWLAATAEITRLMASSGPGLEALQAVADLSREVAGADVSWIVVGSCPEDLALKVVSGAPADPVAMRSIDLANSLAGAVVGTGRAMSVEDLAADPRALDLAPVLGWPRMGPAIVVPLGSAGAVEGVLALAWHPEHVERYRTVDLALPTSFAEQAALALQVARARDDQGRLAVFEDRDRIGRDLHDLVIQRLFAVGLGLQSAARLSGDPAVSHKIEQAVDDLDGTIKDIRRSIFALGSIEASADIQAEVTRLVERARATLKFRPSLRFEGPARTLLGERLAPDLLAVLAEALSNAGRHAAASSVDVVLAVRDGDIVLVVDDDGVGLPDDPRESGVANMRNRAAIHGGSFVLESRAEGGTHLCWRVPANPAD